MSSRFAVLASGSAGNSGLLEVDGFRLLIDFGLGPRKLARRMTEVGVTWDRIRAAILTHTHSDHWKDTTVAQLCRLRIPLYCHSDHARDLHISCPAFAELQQARLVRLFEAGVAFPLAANVTCRPFEVSHDVTPTFGFRFDGQADLFGGAWSLGFVSDLGIWDREMAAALCDVDVLALEFNHDVPMQRASGRTAQLIARVLGDKGHLSNEQAAAFLHEVVAGSGRTHLKHLVQLHLSRQCNRPVLAAEAATQVLCSLGMKSRVHTASQDGTLQIPITREPAERGVPSHAIKSGLRVTGSLNSL